MLTTPQTLLLQALLYMRDNGPQNDNLGICNNVIDSARKATDDDVDYDDVEIAKDWMKDISFQYPMWSGDVDYPVAAVGVNMSAKSQYRTTWFKWDTNTDYGQARYAYLDWLISQLVELDRRTTEFGKRG